MQASLVICKNVFKHQAYQVTAIRRRRRIATLAPDTQKPFICIYNGQPLLRKYWKITTVKDTDVVVFIVCPPQGGGGSNPLGMILSIGLMLAAPGLAASILGAELAGTTVAFGLTAGQLLGGVIAIAGKAIIGSIFGSPGLPKSQINASLAAPSPTYSLVGQGNASRIGDPIPVIYGTMKVYPNYGAQSYTEFAGNEQYLYQLFCIGQGYYDIDGIYIYDTPIASFPEITYEVVQPGGTVTLFPTDVISSGAVSGQELIATILGPFITNNAGTTTNALAVDISLARGLYYANDGGGLDARTVSFRIEAQKINDAGTAVGSWTVLQDVSITAATNTPQRYSYRYNVTAGRYQVRLTRLSAKDTDTRVGNDINWVGLRAYLPGNQQYGNVTMVAMRMRASNSLSAQSSQKVNMIVTRKLPIWNGSAWSAPTRTRSIAWALADICRASYGAGYSDNRIDLAKLISLDTTWASRGDTFNGAYDTANVFWDSLTICAKAGRAKPYMQAGIVHFVRDEQRTLPVAMFNMQNIAQGSVSVDYVMPTEATADVIEMQFWNESIWGWDYINCALPDSTSSTPVKKQIFGVTNRNQAWREGMALAAENKYRRTFISLGSEMEGFIPSFADLCAISHDRPQWGQSGEVVAYDAPSKTVTTSEPLDFSVSGNHYFAFRYRDGSVSVAYQATAGANENQAVLSVALDFVPDIGTDRERTYYTFGVANALYKRALVASIKPRDLMHCDLSFVIDDDRVYTADSGSAGSATPSYPLPVVITRPGVSGLTVTPGAAGKTAIAAWLPSPNTDSYAVEISYDAGASWQRVGTTAATRLEFNVLVGTVRVRVAAVGLTQGDWAVWTGSIFSGVPALPDVANFALTQPFIGRSAKMQWDATAGADFYTITVYSIAVTTTLRRTVIVKDTNYEYTYEDARADGGPWRNLQFKVKAGNANTASANLATITASNPQIAAPSGLFATGGPANITVGANKPTDTDYAGMVIYGSTTSGFTPSSGNLMFDGADNSHMFNSLSSASTYYFKVAFYDNFGPDSLNFSSEISATPQALGGVPTVTDASTITAATGSNPPGGDSYWTVYSLANSGIWSWSKIQGKYLNNKDLTNSYYNLVSAVQGSFGSIAAINANLGNIAAANITLGTGGYVKQGQSAYNTGTGFYLGDVGGVTKFSVGTPTLGFTWDGSTFNVNGTLIATGNILNNAVTNATNAFTAASTFFVPNNNDLSWITIQTISMTTSGATLQMMFGCYIDRITVDGSYTGNYAINIAVFRDGTQILASTPVPSSNLGQQVTVPFSDTPSAGSHTYTLRASAVNNAYPYCYISNKSLQALETKR